MPEEIATQTASTDTGSSAASSATTQATTTQTADASAGAKTGERTYTQADVERMIQERVKKYKDMETKAKKFEAWEGVVDYAANDQEFVNHLNGYFDRAQAKAEKTGGEVDVQQVIREARAAAQREAGTTAMELRMESQVAQLSQNPLFAELKDPDSLTEVTKLAKSLNGDVKKAYFALHGEKALSRTKAETEQAVLASIESRGFKRVESGDAGGEAAKLGLNPAEIAAARSTGIALDRYAANKGVLNYDQWLATRKKG